MNRLRGENRLISLVQKAKSECDGIAQAVRNDLQTIEEARKAGMTWTKITEGLGFPAGRYREVQRAYSREKARLEKRGGVKARETEKGGVKPAESSAVNAHPADTEARRAVIITRLNERAKEKATQTFEDVPEPGTFRIKEDTT